MILQSCLRTDWFRLFFSKLQLSKPLLNDTQLYSQHSALPWLQVSQPFPCAVVGCFRVPRRWFHVWSACLCLFHSFRDGPCNQSETVLQLGVAGLWNEWNLPHASIAFIDSVCTVITLGQPLRPCMLVGRWSCNSRAKSVDYDRFSNV